MTIQENHSAETGWKDKKLLKVIKDCLKDPKDRCGKLTCWGDDLNRTHQQQN